MKYDTLIRESAELFLTEELATVSLLQRRLKLGYFRAYKILVQLEGLGIVGEFSGTRERELLIKTKKHLNNILASVNL